MNEESIAISKDFIRGRKPKILYFDLEISPMLVYTYSAYEANALRVKKQPQIVSVAWQWEGEKKIHARALPDYPGYKPGITRMDDKHLVKEFYDVMAEADVLIGHNIKKFDVTHARARFIYHGLRPTKKWVLEDTLFMARKYFKFPKNDLNTLCDHFGLGSKSKISHAVVIWDCIEGDKQAWKDMVKYNIQDIKLTRDLYKRLGPWHETHYNLNLIQRGDKLCPFCLGRHFKSDGHRYNKASIKQKYECLDCGKYWTGESVARAAPPEKLEVETERVDQANP